MTALNIEYNTLSNGLGVVICPINNSPVVTVQMNYRVGSVNERRGKTGLAHLFEHMMFDNNTSGTKKQYDVFCSKAGGSNNAYTTYDYTAYHITLPSHQVQLGLWLEAERMRSFNISRDSLETQRQVVIEEIKQNVENQPYQRWSAAMDESAFTKESGYSWNVYGYVPDLESVTMEDANHFFETFYHPGNAVLTVCGNIQVSEVQHCIQEYFGSITRSNQVYRPTFSKSHCRKGVHTVVSDTVAVPAVFLAFHVPSAVVDAIYDVDLASQLLSSGKRSILYTHLVSGKKLAAQTGCFVDRRIGSSLITMYAYAMNPSITADELANELVQAVASASPSQNDLNRTVNRVATGVAMNLQQSEGIADSLGWSAMFMHDPSVVLRQVELYESRSLNNVNEVLHAMNTLKNAVRVDVVPAA